MEEYQQQKLSLVPAEQLEVSVEEEEDSELSSLLDYTLAEAVSGRVGVWSKTDSVSYFDQYTVVK